MDGSRWARETEVLIIRPIRSASTPASARALAPAVAAPSVKLTPSGHQRRSWMPASRDSIPGLRPTRSYVDRSRSSISSDVTTTGASTAHTASTAVLVER